MMRSMRRHAKEEFHGLIRAVRGILIYLCLLVLIGGILLVAQASMEVKRIRYSLTNAYYEKDNLLNELQKVEKRIYLNERYSVIADRIRLNLPHLGPPRHPAIEIEIEGLPKVPSIQNPPPVLFDNNNLVSRVRNHWQKLRSAIQNGLNQMLE